MQNNELRHYGVLGMKWGVRRYQNYDGTYTQKGLARYNKASSAYKTASSNYKSTKASYKSGDATKLDVNKAKNAKKAAKSELKTAYSRTKQGHSYDEGKKAYSQGKTISDLKRRQATTIAVGSVAAAAAKTLVTKYSGSDTYGTAAAIATVAVAQVIDASSGVTIKNIRSYYSGAPSSR
jgi:hypothetical protein